MNMNLTPIQILALTKQPSIEKTAREAVCPGLYPVDFTVHIQGTVEVKEDTEKTPTVAIPLKAVVGLLLQRAGATREASAALLLEVMTEALSAGRKADEVFASEVAFVEEAIDTLTHNVLNKLSKIPVKGAVKSNVTLEAIHAACT